MRPERVDLTLDCRIELGPAGLPARLVNPHLVPRPPTVGGERPGNPGLRGPWTGVEKAGRVPRPSQRARPTKGVASPGRRQVRA